MGWIQSLCMAVSAAFLLTAFSAWADMPRPEHPTPQMERAEWVNLNGEWEFAETDDDAADLHAPASQFPDKIVVPFCRESKLSGLERKDFVKNVWYRRTFSVPAEWKSPRVLLHFGACDWRAWVWVNGELAGEHTGGSTPFSFDINRLLRPGENTVVVHAFDDTRGGMQPTGKQSHEAKSHGCVYTRTTGIWQTVWLEGVGASYIRNYYVTPDSANGSVMVRVEVEGARDGLTVEAQAVSGEKDAGTGRASVRGSNATVTLNLSEKRVWSLEDPFLYGLRLRLSDANGPVDSVNGYFGLRDVTIQGAAILINGKAVFQRLVLDQGFYPDGIWTAPTEEALKRDIELSMAVGFNGARLHQKVFEPRFLYWADKLGYIVWGEYNSWGANAGQKDVDIPILTEWLEVVRRDRNHPAIVGWCPYNETDKNWGPLQNATVAATREADPTRPVLDTSGYVHSLTDPELLDAHDYNQDPASFASNWQSRLGDMPLPPRYSCGALPVRVPFFVSEYGGIGWSIHGNGWGYGNVPADLEAFYTRFKGLADAQLDNRRLFGFCYTQLTDIEQEQNGVYTYNREPKFDTARLKAALSRQAAYEKEPPTGTPETQNIEWRVLVGGAPDGEQCRPWRYTFDKPSDAWLEASFSDADWKEGKGGFGAKEGCEKQIGTPWKTKDIWLRQAFEYDGRAFKRASLAIHYDNAAEIYVNGKPLWNATGWNDNYAEFDVTEALRAAVKPGANVIAVHCHQDEGGQFIDLGLLTVAE